MCTAGVAMQDAAAAPIPHLRFGSPFDHDPAHPGGAVDGLVPDQAAEEAPLLAVLWEGVSEGEASKSETPARQSEFERGLGVVTLLVRGRNGQAYSARSAWLADDGSSVLPVPPSLSLAPCCISPNMSNCSRVWPGDPPELLLTSASNQASSPPRTNGNRRESAGEEDASDHRLIPLTEWLSFVRRESSRKAPLPRDWQSLPIESLRLLATERGLLQPDSSDMPRIRLVKFLREWTHGK